MPRIVRYVPDKPEARGNRDGFFLIGDFAVSAQARQPCVMAAYDVIAIAKSIIGRSDDDRNGHYADKFRVNHANYAAKIKTRYGHVPHAIAEIVNDSDSAPAVEFGSGKPSVGDSSGETRVQGGYNKPKRALGRAASKIGDFHE